MLQRRVCHRTKKAEVPEFVEFNLRLRHREAFSEFGGVGARALTGPARRSSSTDPWRFVAQCKTSTAVRRTRRGLATRCFVPCGGMSFEDQRCLLKTTRGLAGPA